MKSIRQLFSTLSPIRNPFRGDHQKRFQLRTGRRALGFEQLEERTLLAFGPTLELSSLSGADGFAINGISDSDQLGASVSSAGDINGDGIDDLIIGANGADPNGSASGQYYVIFGKTTSFAASLEVSTLDGSTGFFINGINPSDVVTGISVSSAEDINGDGIDDLVIGAPDADTNGSFSGQSYVIFGKTTPFSASIELSTLDGTDGFAINGITVGDKFGRSVSSAGDINGDGIGDLIIGAPGADPNGSGSGQSYVIFGKTTPFSASIELSTLDGTNGFVINGGNFGDNSGFSVSSAGDVNDDGVDDLIIGARGADTNGPNSGQSYVIFGKTTPFTASIELSTLSSTDGFAINGISAGDRSGFSVSSAGDINGDGIDDLVTGALDAGPNGLQSGQSYVIFGKTTPFAPSLELSALSGADGFAINGINAFDVSGFSVSSAGDVNTDGIGDLIIGALSASPNVLQSGQSYVVFGKMTPFAASIELSAFSGIDGFALNGINNGDLSGGSVSLAGDINGDGIDDLIIGALKADPNGPESGQSYIIFGREGLSPTATLANAPDVNNTSPPTQYDFTITYSDNTSINVSTFDDMDIRVTGPNGFDQLALFISVDDPTNGSPRTATYRIIPPSGNWDPSDQGNYTISMEADQVMDTSFNSVVAGVLGSFHVCFDPIPITGLVISGTNADDAFILTQNSSGTLNVNLNSTDLGNFSSPDRITIASLCGNDTIVVANKVTVPLHVDGGSDFDIFDFSALGIELTVSIGRITNQVITFENIEHFKAGQTDDTFVFFPEADLSLGILDGMAGTDILDFSRLNAPITANLTTGTLSGVTLSNIEKVRGSLFQSTNVTPSDAVISFGLSSLSTYTSQSTSSPTDDSEDSTDSRRNFTNSGGVTSSNSAESTNLSTDTPPEDNGSDAPVTLNSRLWTLDPFAIDEIMADFV